MDGQRDGEGPGASRRPGTKQVTVRHDRNVLVVNGAVVPAVCLAAAVWVGGFAGGVPSLLLGVLAAAQLTIAWRPALRIDPAGALVRNAVRRRRLGHRDVAALRIRPRGPSPGAGLADHPRMRWRVDVELVDGSSVTAVATERRGDQRDRLHDRLRAAAGTYGIPVERRASVRADEPQSSASATIRVRRSGLDRVSLGLIVPGAVTGLVVALWVVWEVFWGLEALIVVAVLGLAAGTLLPELRVEPLGVTVRDAVGRSRTFGINEVEAFACCWIRHATTGSSGSSPALKVRLADGEEIEVSATRRMADDHQQLVDEVERVLAHHRVPVERRSCCPERLA